jgi:hypothetical protein
VNRILRAIAVATMGAVLLSLSACEGSGDKKDQRKRPQSFADVKKNLEISEKLRDERKAKIAEIEKDASKNEAEKLDEIYRLEALNNAITIVFYGGYVVDAFVDLNTGYSVSLAELDRLTITNPSNGKGMTLDLMEEQYKFEDPWAMAREAASRAEKELGAVPAPPPLDRLALATKHERMIGPYAEADAWLTDAAKAYQEKDMNSVKRYAERALKTKVVYLGTEHPETIRVMNMLRQAKGIAPVAGAATVGAAAAAPAAGAAPTGDAAEADRALAQASASWKSGDIQGALNHATRAHEIRTRILGADHPKTLEVVKMIEISREALKAAPK